jgi:hypothetical protein
MCRRSLVVIAALAAGCGRIGYDATSGEVAGIDGPASDGAAGIDGAPDALGAVLRIADGCTNPTRLDQPLIVDGDPEPSPRLFPMVGLGWTGPGAGPPAGIQAFYQLGWDPDGLYMYASVIDPTRVPAEPGDQAWCGDGIEFYVDSDALYRDERRYDDPGARQLVIAAPPPGQSTARRGQAFCQGCDQPGPIPVASGNAVSVVTSDGYAVEMRVTAAELGLDDWPLAAGDRIGIDIGINVSTETPSGERCAPGGEPQGSRLGQIFLSVTPPPVELPFATYRAFCAVTLIE